MTPMQSELRCKNKCFKADSNVQVESDMVRLILIKSERKPLRYDSMSLDALGSKKSGIKLKFAILLPK